MCALMRTVLTNDQLLSWGWRIPFLSGSLNGLVALYLWMYGHEHHPKMKASMDIQMDGVTKLMGRRRVAYLGTQSKKVSDEGQTLTWCVYQFKLNHLFLLHV